MIWWEKTVEYAFVRSCLLDGNMITPFDGNHEVMGDAMMSHRNKLILIEFKRDLSLWRTEQIKFRDYKEAKAELEGDDSHHFIVAGSQQGEGAILVAQNYFSSRPSSLKNMLEAAVDEETMSRYILRLIKHKLNGEASGKKSILVSSNACLYGVNERGVITTTLTLDSSWLDIAIKHVRGKMGIKVQKVQDKPIKHRGHDLTL